MFHVLSAQQFDRAFLDEMCVVTDTVRKFAKSDTGADYLRSLCRNKRAMLYFSQPSSRTFLSFVNACQVLGIQTSEIRNRSTSSEVKGETIGDSFRTFSSYVDLVIMRTPVPQLCNQIAALLDSTPRPIPVINAGSGPDEHPTQALLDIYTLYRSFEFQNGIDNKVIMMVGDLKRGRTARSLSMLLTHYRNTHIIFCSPKAFQIDDDLRKYLKDAGQSFEETTDFRMMLPVVNAIYMTRVQDEYDTISESVSINDYTFKAEHLDLIKKDAIIMHPLPRRDEIDIVVDKDPRAKYWRQVRNGMWTRVALMLRVFNLVDACYGRCETQ